jgi:hypothetical protein
MQNGDPFTRTEFISLLMVYLTMLSTVSGFKKRWMILQSTDAELNRNWRRFEVMSAVVTMSTICWDVMPCRPWKSLMYQRNVLPLSSGSKIRWSKLQSQLPLCSLIPNMEAVYSFLCNVGDLNYTGFYRVTKSFYCATLTNCKLVLDLCYVCMLLVMFCRLLIIYILL